MRLIITACFGFFSILHATLTDDARDRLDLVKAEFAQMMYERDSDSGKAVEGERKKRVLQLTADYLGARDGNGASPIAGTLSDTDPAIVLAVVPANYDALQGLISNLEVVYSKAPEDSSFHVMLASLLAFDDADNVSTSNVTFNADSTVTSNMGKTPILTTPSSYTDFAAFLTAISAANADPSKAVALATIQAKLMVSNCYFRAVKRFYELKYSADTGRLSAV